MEELTIKIYAASDEGYFYDIFYHKNPEDITEDDEADDGGQCTSEDIGDAIDMAKSAVDSYLLQIAINK
jgi:hypothetical protein